eukprot:scaffold52829_cov57-Phaeocystis_antarctica.AAC.2
MGCTKLLLLAAGLGQSTAWSTSSTELPRSSMFMTCPEAKPVGGACEPALEGLTCEYGPVRCACPDHCQPCEEEICVNTTSATCGEISGTYGWSIVD